MSLFEPCFKFPLDRFGLKGMLSCRDIAVIRLRHWGFAVSMGLKALYQVYPKNLWFSMKLGYPLRVFNWSFKKNCPGLLELERFPVTPFGYFPQSCVPGVNNFRGRWGLGTSLTQILGIRE